MNTTSSSTPDAATRRGLRRGVAAYARWLAGISWRRFFLLALLLLVAAMVLRHLPPFSIKWGEDRHLIREPGEHRWHEHFGAVDGSAYRGAPIDIDIDRTGFHVRTSTPAAAVPASAAASNATAASAPRPDLPGVTIHDDGSTTIRMRPGVSSSDMRHAVAMAFSKWDEAKPRFRTLPAFTLGDHLIGFAMMLILMSAIVKLMAAGRFKAEARAVEATAMAEAETLKRQVSEARMAAMQAQVEPHFLFNTLASIDHLIETDPPRASRMQRNLIALLRAAMPTLREAGASGPHDLGRELAVIRPYLEILKVRMEERLVTEIRVDEALLAAEFPPMMLQGLVENAIKHGLEPRPEGGRLTLAADLVHGKLVVSVVDTGVGFGKASTAGTGIGLANIRERLKLLYGKEAELAVTEPAGGGTAVTITVPYTRTGAAA
jgi:signal transduction histidine kinase